MDGWWYATGELGWGIETCLINTWGVGFGRNFCCETVMEHEDH